MFDFKFNQKETGALASAHFLTKLKKTKLEHLSKKELVLQYQRILSAAVAVKIRA